MLNLNRIINKYYWMIHSKITMILTLNFNFNVPCRTSPRFFSRGSPGC